jgi:2-polyprenyl-3-methyl-5-hydroxy-6-metoxy-1,4-benzoquinol methylase
MELTEVDFWDDYWANVELPNKVDLTFSFVRCLAEALKRNLPAVDGEVLEVGCAPGKWLAFMSDEFGLKPSGIEYSEAGMNATYRNFETLGLEVGKIQAGDFFKIEPDKQYDVVMSYGFIEHFTNVDEVVELHLRWLKPGGVLILGVPNFRGVYSFLQGVLDREVLDKHNLDMMNLDYFSHVAEKYDLDPLFIDYIGSFEPALPISKAREGSIAKNMIRHPLQFSVKCFIWAAVRIRAFKVFDHMNHPFFSSYILSVYKKKY